jgi:norsolorinic acid ketoreductase
LQTLQAAGVTHIDTIVANAAAADTTDSALDTPTDEVIRHLKINVIGILALFQAFEPLLRNAQARNPKFIAVTSELGSIGMAPNMPGPWFCYGVTKAALNYMVRRVHVENDWLTAVALQPGWTRAEVGERAAGMAGAPMELEESVAGCLKVIDSASREKYAGEVVSSGLETSAW